MFFVFIGVTLLALGYVLWHVWCILPLSKVGKWIAVGLMAAAFVSMFLFLGGRLERLNLSLASVLYEVTTSTLFILLYLFMFFLVADVARLCHVLPSRFLHESWVGTAVVVVCMTCIFVAGNIKYKNKVRVPLQISTDKPLDKDYKIVMASDLHLGYHNRKDELTRWVNIINSEKPDLVLIAGDLIDISLRPLIEEDMASVLRQIEAPVYACLGNHEYYSNEPRARQFYQDAGIRLLIDSTALVDGRICIVGRDDRTNFQRKPLDKLMANVADSTFNIVLDHQPYELEKAEQAHVDFQLSGHTHRGQVWPISLITDALYECSWGPLKKGNTQFYVSSGMGIWGGKFRIGTQSEYVVASLSSTRK
jgi:predicted MPP superfamily phosphohydrolase